MPNLSSAEETQYRKLSVHISLKLFSVSQISPGFLPLTKVTLSSYFSLLNEEVHK